MGQEIKLLAIRTEEIKALEPEDQEKVAVFLQGYMCGVAARKRQEPVQLQPA